MNQYLITQLERVVLLSTKDPKSTESMGLKLMEEVGEYAEALNHSLGNLPHKTMKEPPTGEAADTIQLVVCILARIYPTHSPSELIAELAQWLEFKNDKWEALIPQQVVRG